MGELSDMVMQFPYAGLFCLLILGAIGLPFPEDAVLISCGLLISQGIIQPLPAFLAVYTGILIGDFLIYSAGRKYGRAVVTHRQFRKFLPGERLHSLEQKFTRFGWLFIVLGRQVIGLRAQTILVSGILGMSRRTFLAVDAFASFVTIMLMGSVGYLGMNHFMQNRSLGIPGGYAPILALIVIAGFGVLKWRRPRQVMSGNGE
jgi:membrane protein DedA with SNARE-associated domain